MSLDGQGQEAPESMDSLADFLVDNPEADESEEIEAATPDEADEASGDDPAEGDDEPSPEDDPEQTSHRKHKVTVKGEDGADQEIEVEEKELIDGYLRRADYTRKAQELGNREREVTQALATKHQEMQTHYLQQAQMARAARASRAGRPVADRARHTARASQARRAAEAGPRERASTGMDGA